MRTIRQGGMDTQLAKHIGFRGHEQLGERVERCGRRVAWTERARRAFHWFMGENVLGIPMYDPSTGACCDGLRPDGVNENQGAESTLSFLCAWYELNHTVSFQPTLRLESNHP